MITVVYSDNTREQFEDLTEIVNYEDIIKLYCSNNQITSLSLNMMINLEYLDCSNNQITNLDNLPYNLKKLDCYNNPIYHLIKNYFDDDFKKYSIWRKKFLKKFIFKIEDWFLECKYNPKYKYCKLFQIKSLHKIGAIDKDELDKYIKIDI